MAGFGWVDAYKYRDKITKDEIKQITELYKKNAEWAKDQADKYGKLTYKSAALESAYYSSMSRQYDAMYKELTENLEKTFERGLYEVSDKVIQASTDWLEKYGLTKAPFSMGMSSVSNDVVSNIVTGSIYDNGWNLSKSIWGDNDKLLRDIHEIIADGRIKQEGVYETAKKLEEYVNPNRRKPWNLKMSDGKYIYKGKVDYNAQRLVRTLNQHAYQQAVYTAAVENPFIDKVVWHANGSRACKMCLDMEGTEYPASEMGKFPFDHPNGMCVIEPVYRKDYKNIEKEIADWVNSEPGTYPELDKFAQRFGYQMPKPGKVSVGASKGGSKAGSAATGGKSTGKPTQGVKTAQGGSEGVDDIKDALSSKPFSKVLDDIVDGKIKDVDYEKFLNTLYENAAKNGYGATFRGAEKYWNAYLRGEIKNSELDDILKKSFPKVEKAAEKVVEKVAVEETIDDIVDDIRKASLEKYPWAEGWSNQQFKEEMGYFSEIFKFYDDKSWEALLKEFDFYTHIETKHDIRKLIEKSIERVASGKTKDEDKYILKMYRAMMRDNKEEFKQAVKEYGQMPKFQKDLKRWAKRDEKLASGKFDEKFNRQMFFNKKWGNKYKLTEEQLEMVAEDLKKTPDWYKRVFGEGYEYVDRRGGFVYRDPVRGNVDGSYFDQVDKFVKFENLNEYFKDFPAWRESSDRVVFHEVGHAIDDMFGNISQSERFMQAYADDVKELLENLKDDKKFFDRYGMSIDDLASKFRRDGNSRLNTYSEEQLKKWFPNGMTEKDERILGMAEQYSPETVGMQDIFSCFQQFYERYSLSSEKVFENKFEQEIFDAFGKVVDDAASKQADELYKLFESRHWGHDDNYWLNASVFDQSSNGYFGRSSSELFAEFSGSMSSETYREFHKNFFSRYYDEFQKLFEEETKKMMGA